MEGHGDIRMVRSSSQHMNLHALIQGVDNGLLNRLIFLIIQRVDPDNLAEDLLELLSYLRCRKAEHGKAGLLTVDVAVPKLGQIVLIFQRKLLLPLGEMAGALFVHRSKRLTAEDLLAGRTCKHSRQLFVLLIGRPHDAQSSLVIISIQEKGLVRPVVIGKLLVGDAAAVTDRTHTWGCPVDHRLQSHGPEIFHRFSDHPLETNDKTHIDGLLFGEVFPALYKIQAQAFAVYICHALNSLLR